MCKPFSCVVKSDLSVLVGQKITTHSHSEIIRQYGLPQEISIDQYARVELIVNYDHHDNPDKWKLKLDESHKPSWWVENLPEIDYRVRQAAWKWLARIRSAKELLLDDDIIMHLSYGSPSVTLHKGELWTYDNSTPVVSMTGGELRTYDNSAPVVTLNGGELRAYGNSAPVITQAGGRVWVYGQSAPKVEMSGGELQAWDQSAPVITQAGGRVWVYGQSAPKVEMSGGLLRTYGRSAPKVEMSGGELWTYVRSAPKVKMSGGELQAWDQSAPVVEMSGGELQAWDQSAPVVNGVRIKPPHKVEIFDGKLMITSSKRE